MNGNEETMEPKTTRKNIKDIVINLFLGIVLFILTIAIIVTQDKQSLLMLFLSNRLSLGEIVPFMAFIYACGYIWFYTYMAAKMITKRLQLWIGQLRAVVFMGFIFLAAEYF